MRAVVVMVALAAVCVRAQAAGPIVINDMDALQFRVQEFSKEGVKTPAGTVQLVPGKVGQAVQFSFAAEAQSGFFVSSLTPTAEWDKSTGMSFWVKGDGSHSWGGIELINEDFTGRYASCFPIDSTEWRKIEIPWPDFTPETATAPLFGAGRKPSDLRYLAFGKWHYWRDYPAESFAVDQIALEPAIRADRHDYTPRRGGTPRTLAKLRAKQPITIVTMGDSLSDKRHWANREVLWSELLVGNLQQEYGGKVTLVNPAIGGAELTYGLVYSPRWLAQYPAPDLVTVLYGYNDASGGSTPARFRERVGLVVDSLRRLTKGKSEIMLLTTCPAVGRWTEMEGLAQAVRDVAHEKRTGLADLAGAFHRVGDPDAAAREKLFCSDQVHLGAEGHRLAAEAVRQAIAGSK